MKNKINKKEKYGNLTIIKEYKKGNRTYCTVKCECGNIKEVRKSNLVNKHTTSCGCTMKNRGKEIANSVKKYYYDGTFIMSLVSDKLPKNNTSGCRGVTFNKNRNKWVATIRVKGKTYNLGAYIHKEDAIKARKEAEKIYYKPIIEKYEKEKSKTTKIKN